MQKRRQKCKAELEKKLAENNRQWEMIKSSKKSKQQHAVANSIK